MRDLLNLMESILHEGTEVVNIGDAHVLLSEYVIKHIATHNKVGVGSVFARGIGIDQIKKAISNAGVRGDGGAYTVKMPGVGYNLVLPIDQAKQLPGAQLTQVTKTERGQDIQVPAVKTTAPINQFATDQLTLIIRPSNPDYLPDDVKNNPKILKAIEAGKSYSVLTAFPGDPDIPPASQWNNQYAVILPQGE